MIYSDVRLGVLFWLIFEQSIGFQSQRLHDDTVEEVFVGSRMHRP